MPKRSIRDLSLNGRRVLIRVDFNVPLDKAGVISSDFRIRSTLPTIRLAINGGAAVILMSHMGRPTGEPAKDAKWSMDQVAARLAELLRRPVRKADHVVGKDVARVARSLKPGEVFLLENLRFHPGEKRRDESFTKDLAAIGQAYVNDAFGSCQNEDASLVDVPEQFPRADRGIGLLVERELEVLDGLLGKPRQPMIAVLGGGKVSTKIQLVENLLPRIDRLLVGGAMAYTFLHAAGRDVGRSLVEHDHIATARRLAELAGNKLVLPSDHVAADNPDAPAETRVVRGEFPANWFGMDIGPETRGTFQDAIGRAATVIWNGPMGRFEDERFSAGTDAVALAMSRAKAVTVVGGGESVDAVERLKLIGKMTHVSTGGGAFLNYLGGEQFPSLQAVDDV